MAPFVDRIPQKGKHDKLWFSCVHFHMHCNCNHNILAGNPLSKADFQWSLVEQHTTIHSNTPQ